ncbi:MAG: DNA polymerase III subunit chi [Rhodoferax sp.]|nr:DNA polymerase III subunit chi [Rhodoferax sp.]NCP53727.1 DNA polymerase III subunit chi [Rhodoferax sp.]OIP25003.1 MAG: hypothetical protein AUK52_01295 [Comamonadaceae bacterium CG2_30_60_41]
MTSIVFHYNVNHRVDYTCRLVRKGVATGAKLLLWVPKEELEQLDRALWQLSPIEFVPHCRSNATGQVIARSRVVLTSVLTPTTHGNVLVNFCECAPEDFTAFERVIEVVGLDDASRQAARQRWRHYAQAGAELARHDAQGRAMQ